MRKRWVQVSGVMGRGGMRLSFVSRLSRWIAIVAALTFGCCAIGHAAGGTLLSPDQLQKLLPATVYYSGQTASVQVRNAGGVRFPDGHSVLAALVDTSGYSSNVASKYQGYLITEVPLVIAAKRIAAGAYGIGFVSGNKFLITDLGGNDVLTVPAQTDAQMTRPRPLQVVASPDGGFRLYAGRSYVPFDR
jgi:hypothetical protein